MTIKWCVCVCMCVVSLSVYRVRVMKAYVVVAVVFPQDLLEKGLAANNFAMLGLGDIVIPGIFIALLLRFDVRSAKSYYRRCCCCCCDCPAALLLSSVVQVEEVCDCSRIVPQVLHCKLHRMALTVEQMLYGVWCHSTLRTDM